MGCVQAVFYSGFRKPDFLKKAPNSLGFIGFSYFFYPNKQLRSFLVDLDHQLSFYLYLSVL